MCLMQPFSNVKASKGYWRQSISCLFVRTTYSGTSRAGGGARLPWLVTTVMGENG